jgi:hypothetical protein
MREESRDNFIKKKNVLKVRKTDKKIINEKKVRKREKVSLKKRLVYENG